MVNGTIRASSSVKARFNPFDPDFRTNPYPTYDVLRRTGVGHRALGLLILTRHADVTAAFRDRALSSAKLIDRLQHRARVLGVPSVECIVRFGRQSMVFTDPPQHQRLRLLIRQAFTPARLAELSQHIDQVSRTVILTRLQEAQELDGARIAREIPLAVIASKLNIPRDMWAQVAAWTDDMRLLLDPGLLNAAALHACNDAIAAYTRFLKTLIEARRRTSGHDLISELLSLRVGSDVLSEEEVVHACLIMLVGGHATTSALITNVLAALLDHPDQQALLRADPSLAHQAVREALRWDAPLQHTQRLALHDSQIGNTRVCEGDTLLLCIGAANRDPAMFDDPASFLIGRKQTGNLGFGAGMHSCLGAPVAEMEARATLSVLLAGSGNLVPGIGERRRENNELIIRGYSTLPIQVCAA